MKRTILRAVIAVATAVAAVSLTACGNNGDAPTQAPTGVAVVANDSAVTVTWNMEPGLTYWIFSAEAPSITRDNYQQFRGARITQNAVSPQRIVGLTNGATYSFIINASRDGGPAGPASPSVSATPRPAGDAWVVGAPLGADLNAVAFGIARFHAVGAGGALFSSPTADSGSWTAGDSGVGVDLLGIAASGALVAVGEGGTILRSEDGIAWTPRASGTAARLNDVAAGLGVFIAVGDGGTVLRSTDGGLNWSAVTVPTTENLRGVGLAGTLFAVLGDNGTLLTSANTGTDWAAHATGTASALRSIALLRGRFIAVGDAGTVVTSDDGSAWTAQTIPGAPNLRRVASGSQAVAVGDGGVAYSSADGLTWTARSSGTAADLRGLMRGNLLDFIAVGAGGANLVAR